MEEILASIRRIISEDDAPAETAAEAAPEPVAEVVAEPDFEVEDEVLELTEPYEAAQAEVIGDLDVGVPVYEAEAEPEPEVAIEDYPVEDVPVSDGGLVSDTTAANAATAFAGLAASVGRPAMSDVPNMPFDSGNTVEGMVRDMLRPMLKSWLDANLPALVEREVRKEVERIARSAN